MTTTKRSLFIVGTLAAFLFFLHTYLDKETTNLDANQRADIGGSFIELTHGNTHYELMGPADSETVVLVHGFSIPSYLWEPTYKALVKQNYRVLKYDLYGRGFSDRPETNYTIDLFVSQLSELLEKLSIREPIHLVGLSMGGAISARFAWTYSSQIRSLSLIAPLVETPNRVDLTLLKTPLLGEYLATTVMIPKLENSLENTVFDPDAYPEWQVQFNKHSHFKGYRNALLSTARHLAGRSFVDDYRKLNNTGFSSQLIWGEQDPIIPVADSEKILKVLPAIRITKLDKTGHLPQIEQANKVNELLFRFINKSDP